MSSSPSSFLHISPFPCFPPGIGGSFPVYVCINMGDEKGRHQGRLYGFSLSYPPASLKHGCGGKRRECKEKEEWGKEKEWKMEIQNKRAIDLVI